LFSECQNKEGQKKENKLLRLVKEDKTIITDEESMIENLKDVLLMWVLGIELLVK